MKYFTPDEDFSGIIESVLGESEIKEAQQIATGWTNIVLDVKTNRERFIFRFPRDDFWVKAIEKDAELAQFVHGKTDFATVQLELLRDKHKRPFTKHQRFDGSTLAEEINKLSPSQTKTIAQELAKFLYQLHNITFRLDEVFPTTCSGHNLVDFLNELLEVHIPKKDFEFWNYQKLKASPANCLVHGDFNTSNVLLTPDYHIAAILDFGFGGLGNKYDDLSRILSREHPDRFKEELTKSYEKLSGDSLDKSRLNDSISVWQNIDQAYIKYMTKIGIYQPE